MHTRTSPLRILAKALFNAVGPFLRNAITSAAPFSGVAPGIFPLAGIVLSKSSRNLLYSELDLGSLPLNVGL